MLTLKRIYRKFGNQHDIMDFYTHIKFITDKS